MRTIFYDENKSMAMNVVGLFKFVNWLYREMLEGRVPMNKEELKGEIGKVDLAQSIAFVTLAEEGKIDDVTAGEHTEIFESWQPGKNYTVGQLRKYEAVPAVTESPVTKLYRCIQAHTSQEGWEPDKAQSLWVKVSDPTEEFPQWSQPIGAQDAYALGSKVSHNDKHWESSINNNVWEPGVYGWNEVQ